MTQNQAKLKIKNHIEKYGKQTNFKISNKLIKYWWNILNASVFDNVLIIPKFYIRPMRGAIAECVGIYYTNKDGSKDLEVEIHFNSDKKFTRQSFIAVLVHEMVHEWQYENREDIMLENRMSHGGTFSQWRETIEDIVGVKLETLMLEHDVLVKIVDN